MEEPFFGLDRNVEAVRFTRRLPKPSRLITLWWNLKRLIRQLKSGYYE